MGRFVSESEAFRTFGVKRPRPATDARQPVGTITPTGITLGGDRLDLNSNGYLIPTNRAAVQALGSTRGAPAGSGVPGTVAAGGGLDTAGITKTLVIVAGIMGALLLAPKLLRRR